MRKWWTSDREQQVAALFLAGMSAAQIAEHMGRGRRAIEMCLTRLRQSGELQQAVREAKSSDRGEIWSLFYGESADEEIAQQLGMPVRTVIRKRLSLGLRRNRYGKPVMG